MLKLMFCPAEVWVAEYSSLSCSETLLSFLFDPSQLRVLLTGVLQPEVEFKNVENRNMGGGGERREREKKKSAPYSPGYISNKRLFGRQNLCSFTRYAFEHFNYYLLHRAHMWDAAAGEGDEAAQTAYFTCMGRDSLQCLGSRCIAEPGSSFVPILGRSLCLHKDHLWKKKDWINNKWGNFMAWLWL